jgi:hypothetical protein
MPRLTAAAFCAACRVGRRCRNGETLAQLPGIAASIATIAPLLSPVSARTNARHRAAAASRLASSGASASRAPALSPLMARLSASRRRASSLSVPPSAAR